MESKGVSGRVGPGHDQVTGQPSPVFTLRGGWTILLLNRAPRYSVKPLPVAQSRLWKMTLCSMYMPRAGTTQTLSLNPALRIESGAMFQVNIPNFPQLQIELKI